MAPLQGRIKDLPRNLVLDEKIMISIARMIAYVTVFSTHHNNASPEMTKHAIELDARLVDEWLMSKHEGDEYVCKKCKS